MVEFPGELKELRDKKNPTVLFCGAGLSIGAVPDARGLYEHEHNTVELKLGIEGSIDHTKFDSLDREVRLYAWADDVLAELEHQKVSLPKLRFAEALRLLDDPRWWGKLEIDFRGNAPRHRVIARFTKEGLLQSIWSFNWDCILENTLEQVGLPNCEPRFDSPWEKSHYITHAHNDYYPRSNDPRALNIHKPHGCVRVLRAAKDIEGEDDTKADELSYRLMVGNNELHDRSSQPKAQIQDQHFFTIMGSDVDGRFNLAVGWSMSEKSLKNELIPRLSHNGTKLAVIDPNFSIGHQEICQASGFDEHKVHYQLEFDDCPNRDDFFLWQQSQYTLEQLEAHNGNNAILDNDGENWKSVVHPCNQESFFKDWADEFLPTWTRLCWSGGLVVTSKMPSHRIDLDRRDEHIPLGYDHIERPDLKAAIKLLNSLPDLGAGFDARTFPGGLFHGGSSTLVIPLPCWSELNELRAFRPLVDALREKLGYVSKMAVWPIGKTGDCITRGEILRERMASFMSVPYFADPEHIRLISDIPEVMYESH